MDNKTTKLVALLALAAAIQTSANAGSLEDRVAKLEKQQKTLGDIDIFGRLQYDHTVIASDSTILDLQNNSKLRRGRIGVKGKVDGGWKYKFEIDFASNNSKVTDAYLAKNLDDSSVIKIGQFKEPFSLEELTSSRFTTFIERSAINGFVPGRNIGVGYNRYYDNFNVQAGIFGDSVGDSSSADNESTSATARFTNFGNIAGSTYHLGAAYRASKPTGDSVTYSFKPEASVETSSSVIKATITNANSVEQIGLELAYVAGPFSVQGEYISTEIETEGVGDQKLDGYYGQVSLFLSDDQRSYNKRKSAFERVKPKSDQGALEIAYRYSEVDSQEANAGIIKNTTVGVNWYASNNVRFSTNYVWVDADVNTVYGNDAEIFSARAQLDF
ncbi:MAG: hypothetical protein HON23_01805 [Rickettsiales bacterium]|jgi:phosphate-selective porin OprO and OprP|nr:hypothetical protein [Rickettsiales bacterium]